MKEELLDEEIIHPVNEKRMRLFWLEVLLSVIFMSFFYALLIIFVLPNFGYNGSVQKELIESSFSIIHLIMTMAFVNYNVCKGDFKMNIESGLYVVLFGSGLFLFGAVTTLIQNYISFSNAPVPDYYFWEYNYEHFITIGVILVKLILIRPIAQIFQKIAN